ncbi:unnamed protein product, partial [Amoebophrya sp. A25]
GGSCSDNYTKNIAESLQLEEGQQSKESVKEGPTGKDEVGEESNVNVENAENENTELAANKEAGRDVAPVEQPDGDLFRDAALPPGSHTVTQDEKSTAPQVDEGSPVDADITADESVTFLAAAAEPVAASTSITTITSAIGKQTLGGIGPITVNGLELAVDDLSEDLQGRLNKRYEQEDWGSIVATALLSRTIFQKYAESASSSSDERIKFVVGTKPTSKSSVSRNTSVGGPGGNANGQQVESLSHASDKFYPDARNGDRCYDVPWQCPLVESLGTLSHSKATTKASALFACCLHLHRQQRYFVVDAPNSAGESPSGKSRGASLKLPTSTALLTPATAEVQPALQRGPMSTCMSIDEYVDSFDAEDENFEEEELETWRKRPKQKRRDDPFLEQSRTPVYERSVWAEHCRSAYFHQIAQTAEKRRLAGPSWQEALLKVEWSNSDGHNFEVVCYHALSFHLLRHYLCGSDREFAESLSKCDRLSVTGGKSKAAFLVTHDSRYLLKEMNRQETK